MKQIVKMSRLAGMLEKAFNLLNTDWFDGKLETPIKMYPKFCVTTKCWH